MEQKIERRAIKIDGITYIVMVKVLPYMGPKVKKNEPKPVTAVPKHHDMRDGIVRHGYKG